MTEPVMVGGAPAPASNKRALIMLGVAALVAVMALVLPKLLFGGGDEPADDAQDFAVVAPTDGLVGGVGTEPVAEPARTFEVFSTKNPFTPLIDMTPVAAVLAAPVDGTAAAPVAVDLASGAAPVAGTNPVAGVAPVDATPAAAGSAADEPSSGQRVALLEVFVNDESATVASIRVNDTVYEVAEGTAFAMRYKAVTLSVADGCGQFLYGDDRFRLCEGEELLK